jgi:2-polyprenyl-3-methyl-5-hydroxy-6-metoxy-1,4-benzoquinol methylase
METTRTFDEVKAETFAEGMLNKLNSGALCIMLSIGHRTGLFDTIKDLPPSTSKKIADSACLQERYVREWLGAMVVGGIVDVHSDSSNGNELLYSLPAEHAAFLTREAGADNIAVMTQYLPLMGSVEDKIIESFSNGGGVSYTEYKRFHEVMAERSALTVVSSLIGVILPLIPGIKEKLTSGIEVTDIGCGRGRALILMAETFPNSLFFGYDLSEEAISYARAAARDKKLNNVHFEVRDLSTFDNDAPEKRYDFITAFDAIHDQAWPDRVLAGINKALKDDGVVLMQDIKGSSHLVNNLDHPAGPFLYSVSTMHCMTVSLAQGGMGLGTMWGKELALKMLKDAGFNDVEVKSLEHDFQNYYYIVRK